MELLKREASYALSTMQRDIYLEVVKNPGKHSNRILFYSILNEGIDISLWQEALEIMLHKHPVLRTRIRLEDNEPMQYIQEEVELNFNYEESLEETKEIRSMIQQKCYASHDLDQELVRNYLFKLKENKYVASISIHHIITDGGSVKRFFDELFNIYQRLRKGEQVDKEVDTAYFEHYLDQHQQKFDTPEVKSYWTEKLKEVEPMESNAPSNATRKECEQGIRINRQEWESIQAFCKKNKVSPALYFKALYALGIQKECSPQSDLVIREILGGRKNPSIANSLGCMVQVLPLVISKSIWENNHTISEYLAYVKQQKKELGDREFVSTFLQNKLIGEEEVQFSYNYQNFMQLEHQHPLENIYRDSGNQVRFKVIEEKQAYQLYVNYDAQYFYGEYFLQRLKLLSTQILNSTATLSELVFITNEEKEKLHKWNETELSIPTNKTFVNCLEEWAEKDPVRTALSLGDQRLSYRELNERSNQLAHMLLEMPNSSPMVALSVERSFDMIIAIVAILKAGRAYVPVDPHYPQARIRQMLDDCKAPLWITQSSLAQQLPLESAASCKLLFVDKTDVSTYPRTNPDCGIDSDDLAYVIYTSGSTGNPKGVMIEHSALSNMLFATQKSLGIGSEDSYLQFASVNFDASVQEILCTLATGARLILLPTNRLKAEEMEKHIREQQASIINYTPAYWQQISGDIDLRNYSALRLVILGGESLPSKLVEQSYPNLHLDTKFANIYGPTEATVYTSYYIQSGIPSEPHGADIPIGKPISNHHLYILDAKRKLAPLGANGELWIAGKGLARAYLNRPELTAERFVEVEVLGQRQRMYRTGDLARWMPDGNIEFLGRIDHQVKIRGFRIEPGEIEAALQQHPEVKDCVVVVKDNGLAEKHLVACIVARSGEKVDTDSLKEFLKHRIPEYMLPSFYILLKELPFTPSGKVDRKHLQSLAQDLQPEETNSFKAASTSTQKHLVEIWQNILNIDRVGINDNFFERGGHSLKALKLLSMVQKQLQVELQLKDIFDQPNIESLSTLIDRKQQKSYKAIPKVEDQEYYKLSPAQQRLWIVHQMEEESTAYNMPFVFELKGNLNVPLLEKAIHALIERHESLRTVFREHKGEARQKILQVKNVFKDLSVQEVWQDSYLKLCIEQEDKRFFDLTEGPLFVTQLLQTGNDSYVLLINLHHLISDGWSNAVLFRELSQFYNAFKQEHSQPLEPLPIQYKDFAQWHNLRLQSEDYSRDQDYWEDKLSGELPVLNLPYDYPRPKVRRYKGKTQSFLLNKDTQQKLERFNRKHGISHFVSLQTVFKMLLYKYTGQQDIMIGSITSGRQHPDLDKQIGFFVNTLVLRDRVGDDDTMETLVRSVESTSLEALEHQDYPFDKLVEGLQGKRDLSRSPLFDVLFAVQNNEQSVLELEGMEVHPKIRENEVAKFDLNLDVIQSQDELQLSWNYNTDLFKPESVTAMAEQFQTLLQAVLEQPDKELKYLDMLPEQQKKKLLTWNQTAVSYPKHESVVDLFERQVEQTPERIAVVGEGETLSYLELNQKANQLANYLQKHVSPEQKAPLAICLQRSPEQIVAMLAVLKAGFAYIPLDPDYPKNRLHFMLQDAKVAHILSYSHMQNHLALAESGINCSGHYPDQLDLSGYSGQNPVRDLAADQPAYIIYTSGSMGQPKGVEIGHSALYNFVRSSIDSYAIGSQDKVLQFASVSFDAAVEEIYPCLTTGASLVLRSDLMLSTTKSFLQASQEHEISVLDLPTAFWHSLMSDGDNLKKYWPDSVRLVIIGGEAASEESVRMWMENFGSFPVLLNTYGPTEATVVASVSQLSPFKTSSYSKVPIGSPIANTGMYIMDRHMQVQPIGIPGELCISGAGLAQGYLNRPEQSASSFVEANIWGKNKRIYKTGDLARWLPGGQIEYLGRIDQQVKIRGFRIEPGEIEAVLHQHPLVKEAVLSIYQQQHDKQLAAYLSLMEKDARAIETIRTWLKDKLPAYMIPAYFTVLDHLPLTPSGKIDRKALPAPDKALSVAPFAVAHSTAEKRISDVWMQILGREQISVHDNFFDLGGHSLLAIKINGLLQEEYPQLRMVDIFTYPTIQSLAEYLEPKGEVLETAEAGQSRGEKRRAGLAARKRRNTNK